MDECARRCFGLDARVSEGPLDVAPELRGPGYSTALGLLHYALTGQEDRQRAAKPTGILRKLTGLLSLD